MKNVKQRRTKGFITHEDVIRISKLQEELFPDYDFLKLCLDKQHEAVLNKTKPPPLKDLIQTDNSKIYADNELIPLSYSGICDPQKTIVYKEPSITSNKAKNAFIEQFPNPYYSLCREKLSSVDNKKEIFNQERRRQQEKSRMPSQGFFTSKIAKSPSLFESQQY